MSSDDSSTQNQTQKMRGIIGLANLGNTCYMNSAIQAFRHCPEWTLFCSKDTLNEHIRDPTTKAATTLLAYQDLVKSLWGGTGPAYVKPMGFYTELKKAVTGTVYDVFIQRSPQDAHEFLMWLLDQMYMATQKHVDITVPNSASLVPMQQEAIKAYKEAFEKQYSPLTDLIFGINRIQYKCHGCEAVHTRWETFNCLKIPLGKREDGTPWTILESIEHEFKPEEIEGYACDACKNKCTTTKTPSIWRLPKVLLISLRRFTPFGTRDNSQITYDGETVCLDKFFSPESTEATRKKEYKLFSTVDHHGNHMGGHYTAQTLNPVWKVWHRYDDESAISIEKPQFGVATYMLLFR